MAEIVLTTLNARYPHSAFGLRYLLANMGPLREKTTLLEFTVNRQTNEVLDEILAQQPRIVGIGVYIWNVEQATRLVTDLKRLRPEITVIVGGPEVSFEVEEQAICESADYIITGEADLAFGHLCEQIFSGSPPLPMKVIAAPLPQMEELCLPYELYSACDIRERVIYVEVSRGCPYRCEFCLSSLDIPVRQFFIERFLPAMQSLLDRGARTFKFVDRTFNLNLKTSRRILEFFLERYCDGLFLHFEMIPDRFPNGLRELIAKFPPGSLQFEVGVQTFNEEVAARIERRQDNRLVEENLTFLRDETGVHVHADLIAGLPGESLESFAAGFDRLVRLKPQEIQVGILKRLRGTPIVRHNEKWGMVYSQNAPYEILENRLIDFQTFGQLRRFARFWDLVGNSGNFIETAPAIWRDGSPFFEFLKFSAGLFDREGATHGIPLVRLSQHVFEFLTSEKHCDEEEIAGKLWRDYQRGGRTDRPHFLRRFALDVSSPMPVRNLVHARQSRHVR